MTSESKHIIITSSAGWKFINIHEIIAYKDLIYFMILRNITVQYKQSVLGFAWAIINPVFSMLVFSIVFGRLAALPSDDIPYPIFSYLALIPWTYFSGALNASSTSLVTNMNIFTKVYFPRLIIPIVSVFSKLAEFFISFLVLGILMVYYKFIPGVEVIILPLLMLIMILSVTGIGTLLAALAIQYRDVKFGITFMTPLLMYVAPVVFPAKLVIEKVSYEAYLVYGLYPMTGVIEGFRAAFIPTKTIPWDLVGVSLFSSIILFLIGTFYFRRIEKYFADVA